jgi:hypothetical protein
MATSDNEIGSMAAVRDGSGPASWGENVWHTENIHKYPVSQAQFNELDTLIANHCLTGHKPKNPVLKKEGNVVAIGSCFAAELRHFLSDVGLSSESFWIPSGLNNTFALLDFFSWAITGEQTAKGYAYKRDQSGKVVDWQPEFEQNAYKDAISKASCFVFTLGLSEVWEDKETGKIFWRGVPEHIFEAGRHHFRLSTSTENNVNISEIVTLIRSVNNSAPIIFTLSPVPLKATFSSQACITADCISKSTLRVAIHEFMSNSNLANNHVYYWPSFEIVKWVGCHLPYPVYGTDDGCVRHVSRFLVNSILKAFVDSYYGSAIAQEIFSQYLPSLETYSGKAGEPPLIYKGQIVKA